MFTEAHLMGAFSGVTCIPSRAMLNSGKQLFHLTDIGHTLPITDITHLDAQIGKVVQYLKDKGNIKHINCIGR